MRKNGPGRCLPLNETAAFLGAVYESRTFYRVIGGLNETSRRHPRFERDGTFNAGTCAPDLELNLILTENI